MLADLATAISGFSQGRSLVQDAPDQSIIGRIRGPRDVAQQPASPTAADTTQTSPPPQQPPLLGGFVNMDLSGKIRDKPLSDIYMRDITGIVRGLGDGIDINVVSGGQDAHGPNRTGSHRHDVDENGVAHTADFVLTRNGQVVRPADDPALYERLFEAAGSKFSGAGHYPWGVHIGGGSPAFWGPDTTSATADSRFADAWNRGRGNYSGPSHAGGGGNAHAHAGTAGTPAVEGPQATQDVALMPTEQARSVVGAREEAVRNATPYQGSGAARSVASASQAPAAQTQLPSANVSVQGAPQVERSADAVRARPTNAETVSQQWRWLDGFFKSKVG